MVNLNDDEMIVYEKSVNLKTKYKKTPGSLIITNKKILFSPFLSKKSIIITMNDVHRVELIKGFIKKMKVIAKKKEYVFSIRGAKDVVRLVKALKS